MKRVLCSFIVPVLTIYSINAQTTTATEDENYKHANTVHQHHSNTLVESDTIALRNQKTQKTDSRKYIIVPSDSLPNNNVQGKKTKANYKNQFN